MLLLLLQCFFLCIFCRWLFFAVSSWLPFDLGAVRFYFYFRYFCIPFTWKNGNENEWIACIFCFHIWILKWLRVGNGKRLKELYRALTFLQEIESCTRNDLHCKLERFSYFLRKTKTKTVRCGVRANDYQNCFFFLLEFCCFQTIWTFVNGIKWF